jgi:TolA-binding protein
MKSNQNNSKKITSSSVNGTDSSNNIATHSSSTNSNALNLETLKMRFQQVLNQYNQARTNFVTYLSQYPPGDYISNGNFANPTISNDSYMYINDSSKVPSWTFNNGALLNNSSAWGYTMPYPHGNQAVSLQQTASISQIVNLNAGSYNLRFSACGRNCCDNSGQSNLINVQINGTTFYSFQPPINVWTEYNTEITIDASGSNTSSDTSGNNTFAPGSVTIGFVGTWSSGDRSSAIQNVLLTYNNLTSLSNSILMGGSSISHSQVSDVQSCMASCSSLMNCSGATYNSDQQVCSLISGKGNVVSSSNSSNYAITSQTILYLNGIKQLNQQLTEINDEIKSNIRQEAPLYRKTIQDLQTSTKELDSVNTVLKNDREQIKELLKHHNKLNEEQTQSNIFTSSHYAIYLFLFLLAVIFIILLSFITITNNSGASATVNNTFTQFGGGFLTDF